MLQHPTLFPPGCFTAATCPSLLLHRRRAAMRAAAVWAAAPRASGARASGAAGTVRRLLAPVLPCWPAALHQHTAAWLLKLIPLAPTPAHFHTHARFLTLARFTLSLVSTSPCPQPGHEREQEREWRRPPPGPRAAGEEGRLPRLAWFGGARAGLPSGRLPAHAVAGSCSVLVNLQPFMCMRTRPRRTAPLSVD